MEGSSGATWRKYCSWRERFPIKWLERCLHMRNSVCSNGGRLIGCDHSSRGGQRNSDPKIEMRNVGLLLPRSPLSRTMQKTLLATAVSLCMALRPATAADLEPVRRRCRCSSRRSALATGIRISECRL